MESLANDLDESVVIYVSNEPNKLRAEGYDLDVMTVSDYLSLVANGLITSEDIIAKQPELVSAMVKATTRGVEYAAQHPDEAYDICLKYVENLADLTQVEQEVQKQVLQASIKLWQVNQPGYTDPQAWQNMEDLLLQMQLIKNPLDLSAAYSNEFLPEE